MFNKMKSVYSGKILISFLIAISVLLQYMPSFAQFQQEWARQYRYYDDSNSEVYAVAVDNSGNVYVTGMSDEQLGSTSIATIKYSSSGVQQWVQRYTNYAWEDRGISIAAVTIESNTYVYVTGRTSIDGDDYNYVTLKYHANSTNGGLNWAKTYDGTGSGNDIAQHIEVDAEGNSYVTGESWNGSNYDYVTIKYNSSGLQQWLARYNGGGNDYAKSLAFEPTYSKVYVTGTSGGDIVTIEYNSSGIQTWQASYDNGSGNDIAVYWQQGVFVAGVSNDNIITQKYALSNGGLVWSQSGGTGTGNSIGLFPKSSGGGEGFCCVVDIFVTGENDNLDCGRTIKYNNNGTEQWAVNYSTSSGVSFFNDLVIDQYENVYVTGQGEYQGEADFLTVQYDYNGTQNGVGIYADDRGGESRGIRVDENGNIFVAGFVKVPTGSTLWEDYLTIKYAPTGNYGPNNLQNPTGNGNLITGNVPKVYFLDQNYPNPFNPVTFIKYAIPEAGFVKVFIYDVLGQEVSQLVDEYKEAGYYDVRFDGSNLSSGIYIYKIYARNFTDTRKMVLIK